MTTTDINALIGPMPYTLTTWRECVIWLRCENGAREVVADVYGVFAVQGERGNMVVTHIPTGRKVLSCGYKENAMRWAVYLSGRGKWNTCSAAKLKALMEMV